MFKKIFHLISALILFFLGFLMALSRQVDPSDPPNFAKRVDFEYFENLNAKKVFLIGDFNDWQVGKTPMYLLNNKKWITTLKLNPNTYNYAFSVDGKIIADPNCKENRQHPISIKKVIINKS